MRTDGRIHRHKEANNRSSQFYERAWKQVEDKFKKAEMEENYLTLVPFHKAVKVCSDEYI